MGWKGWVRFFFRLEAGFRFSLGVCWWFRGVLRVGRRAGRSVLSRRVGGGLRGESGRRFSGRRGAVYFTFEFCVLRFAFRVFISVRVRLSVGRVY